MPSRIVCGWCALCAACAVCAAYLRVSAPQSPVHTQEISLQVKRLACAARAACLRPQSEAGAGQPTRCLAMPQAPANKAQHTAVSEQHTCSTRRLQATCLASVCGVCGVRSVPSLRRRPLRRGCLRRLPIGGRLARARGSVLRRRLRGGAATRGLTLQTQRHWFLPRVATYFSVTELLNFGSETGSCLLT